jgi:hypothetical protein
LDALPAGIAYRLVYSWVGKALIIGRHLNASKGAGAQADPAAKTIRFWQASYIDCGFGVEGHWMFLRMKSKDFWTSWASSGATPEKTIL